MAVWALLVCLILAATSSSAQNTESLDNALEGFEHPGSSTLPANRSSAGGAALAQKESAWRLGGSLETGAAWSYLSHRPPSAKLDYQGLTSWKSLLRLEVDGQLGPGWLVHASGHAWYDLAYTIRGREQFSSQMLEGMEEEAELDQAYIRGPLAPGLELKLGRQVVNWSRSDLFGGLAVFNPQDQREPGMYGPRDTLLPVAMAHLEWAVRPWSLALVFQPEQRFDKLPLFGSDFYPFSFPLPPRESLGAGLGSAGWGFRLGRDFPGYSLAVFGASYSRERDLVGLTETVSLRPADRLWLAGMSGDLARGNFVFKLDAGVVDGLKYYQLPGESKTRLDFTAGVDYAGFTDTTLIFEVAYRHLFGLDGDMAGRLDMPRRDTLVSGLKLVRTFLRERLAAGCTYYLIGLDGSHGGAQKLSLTYKLMDGVLLSCGAIFFQSGDNYLFEHIGNNDRLFLKVVYSF